MFGFGVVDRPAYPGSVATMRSWAEYRSAHGLAGPEDEPEPTPEPEPMPEPEPELVSVYRFALV